MILLSLLILFLICAVSKPVQVGASREVDEIEVLLDELSIHPEINEDSNNSNYLFSSCNGQPIVRKENIMKIPPSPAVSPEVSFSIQLDAKSGATLAYRFRNHSGLRFDGNCALPDLENGVILYPGPASVEFTWFAGI